MSNFAYQVSNSTYQGDGIIRAYQGNSGVMPVVVVVDKHDGVRKRKHYQELIEAREQLREQIRVALEGPQAAKLNMELEKIAVPQVADSIFVPLVDRIDYDALSATIIEDLKALYRELDEEMIMLLLATQ